MSVIAWPARSGWLAAANRGVVLRSAGALLAEIGADQAQVQVPALGTPIGAPDACRHDARVAGLDDALGLRPQHSAGLRPGAISMVTLPVAVATVR